MGGESGAFPHCQTLLDKPVFLGMTIERQILSGPVDFSVADVV